MNHFKRRTAKLESGRYMQANLRGVGVEVESQMVQIIRPANEIYEEEDRFIVSTDRGTVVVDGCDLHPHPEAPATNVELISHIMENGRTAMVQAFIMDAVAKMAERVVANADKVKLDMEGSMISGDAWVGAAQEVLDGFKEADRA